MMEDSSKAAGNSSTLGESSSKRNRAIEVDREGSCIKFGNLILRIWLGERVKAKQVRRQREFSKQMRLGQLLALYQKFHYKP
jgi:hypothetical protein